MFDEDNIFLLFYKDMILNIFLQMNYFSFLLYEFILKSSFLFKLLNFLKKCGSIA